MFLFNIYFPPIVSFDRKIVLEKRTLVLKTNYTPINVKNEFNLSTL